MPPPNLWFYSRMGFAGSKMQYHQGTIVEPQFDRSKEVNVMPENARLITRKSI
jgi:hypothetical protein